MFGHKDPIGHVDFYPNGGVSSQPTCPMSIYGGCSAYSPRVSPLLVLGPLAGIIGISLIQVEVQSFQMIKTTNQSLKKKKNMTI